MQANNIKHQTSNPKLTLGFSPCPNDTFMFDAMVQGKVDTEGLQFEVVMEDVETLNRKAFQKDIDITKLSYAAYLNVINDYMLLDSGSALGEGVGPLVIAKTSNLKLQTSNTIAIPGANTTANFLFSIFFPDVKNKTEMIFSEIEDAVLSEKVDAGVIIHENRFTYEQKGLKKVCDLGELWEKETKQPIPLGGIAIKRSLSIDLQQKINRIMRRSVEFAFANPASSYDYVKQHAQEMEEGVRKKHIALYVNQYSIDLGEKGRKAIETLFAKAIETGITATVRKDIFVESEKSIV
jgi:1,4-dihydroxy-6-naphthoate synthase